MKRSGVTRAASASTSIVSVSSLRLFSSSKRWSETMPNGPSGTTRARWLVGHELEAVANRVRARVDDLAAAGSRRPRHPARSGCGERDVATAG